jgi:hypothetical protein
VPSLLLPPLLPVEEVTAVVVVEPAVDQEKVVTVVIVVNDLVTQKVMKVVVRISNHVLKYQRLTITQKAVAEIVVVDEVLEEVVDVVVAIVISGQPMMTDKIRAE